MILSIVFWIMAREMYRSSKFLCIPLVYFVSLAEFLAILSAIGLKRAVKLGYLDLKILYV